MSRWRSREEPAVAPKPVLYRAPLPGAQILNVEDVTVGEGADRSVIGFRLTVRGVDVTQHADVIKAARASIASAYHTSLEAVTFRDLGDHHQAVVEVLSPEWMALQADRRRERIHGVHLYPGPTLDVTTGVVSLGVIAETGLPMEWQLWVPGQGARHGWAVGSTRGGKSVGISGLMTSACSRGLVVPCLADLQGGVSMPEWEGVAPYYETTEAGAAHLLRRLVLEMERRIAFMKSCDRHDPRRVVLDPSPQWPLILGVFDEAPRLVRNAQAMEDANTLVTMAGKTGIPIVWLSQVANLDRSFGPAGVSMREQLQAGNTWVFHTGRTTASLSVGSHDIDVTSIPRIAGVSILVSPRHEIPPLGRAWQMVDRPGIVDRYVDIPDYQLADVPGAASATVLTSAPADGDEAKRETCLTAVTDLFSGLQTGDSLQTGDLMKRTGYSKSSVHSACQTLATQGRVRDGGYGKWVKL